MALWEMKSSLDTLFGLWGNENPGEKHLHRSLSSPACLTLGAPAHEVRGFPAARLQENSTNEGPLKPVTAVGPLYS